MHAVGFVRSACLDVRLHAREVTFDQLSCGNRRSESFDREIVGTNVSREIFGVATIQEYAASPRGNPMNPRLPFLLEVQLWIGSHTPRDPW